jgi:hypothetical protein
MLEGRLASEPTQMQRLDGRRLDANGLRGFADKWSSGWLGKEPFVFKASERQRYTNYSHHKAVG